MNPQPPDKKEIWFGVREGLGKEPGYTARMVANGFWDLCCHYLRACNNTLFQNELIHQTSSKTASRKAINYEDQQ